MSYTNPHAPMCYWHDFTNKVGAPNIKWCEETLCQIVSEPANTWTNLSYMIFAYFTWKMFQNDNRPGYKQFGWSMFFMGAMSFVYHMSNNYFSQVLDFVGMYVFLVWIILVNFKRLGWRGNMASMWSKYLSIVMVMTALVHIMYKMMLPFQLLVAVIGVVILVQEIILFKAKIEQGKSYKDFILAAGFLAAAQTFSQLDLHRIMCDPTNHWWQGHANWHVLAGIGLYFLVRFYKQPQILKS